MRFYERTGRALIAAILAVALITPAAPALAIIGPLPIVKPPAPVTPPEQPVEYTKPVTDAHPDTVPAVTGVVPTRPDIAGPTLPAPAAPLPDGSGGEAAHAVVTQYPNDMAAGAAAGGSNNISFAAFQDGDIVVITDPSSITGHAGIFDARYYLNLFSYAVLSANVSPANGVQREQCLKYRAADRAWGLWVPKEANHGVAARNYAYKQMGKPYNLFAAKTDLRSFYCSKLVWVAWRYTSGLDLDGDGGYWVWPIDLVTSRNTRIFGYWS